MKKPIVVKEENKQRIEKILYELQKRCTARIISAQEIIDACERLDKFIYARSKKDLKGITALIDLNAQSFAKAYKYVPYSTQFEVEHMGSYWRLNWIKRDPVHYTRTTHITLTDKALSTMEDYYCSCGIC